MTEEQVEAPLPTFGVADENDVILVTENEDGELEFPQAPPTSAVLS